MARPLLRTAPGFALPTVLVASVVLLMVLVTAVSTTVAVANGLREQNYLRHAGLAAEAGDALATACLGLSNGAVTWSDSNPLRPNTNCSGTVDSSKTAYVLNSTEEGFRTYFVVDSSREAKGFVEALRTSSGLAWRVWTSTASAAQVPGGDANPVGTYIEGAWMSVPAGYLIADGSAVSRTTYANLFAVIGTTYGAGNGSTTFNLPDTRGRGSVAKSSTESEFNSLGERGGEKAHTLTVGEIPSHSHVEYVPLTNGTTRPWSTETSGTTGTPKIAPLSPTGSSESDGVVTTGNAGGGNPHNVLDPYIVVIRAIKY